MAVGPRLAHVAPRSRNAGGSRSASPDNPSPDRSPSRTTILRAVDPRASLNPRERTEGRSIQSPPESPPRLRSATGGPQRQRRSGRPCSTVPGGARASRPGGPGSAAAAGRQPLGPAVQLLGTAGLAEGPERTGQALEESATGGELIVRRQRHSSSAAPSKSAGPRRGGRARARASRGPRGWSPGRTARGRSRGRRSRSRLPGDGAAVGRLGLVVPPQPLELTPSLASTWIRAWT